MRRWVGVVVVVAAACAHSQVARAANWSLQPIPAPRTPTDSLAKVSCTASNACTAVGYSVSLDGHHLPLVERWGRVLNLFTIFA